MNHTSNMKQKKEYDFKFSQFEAIFIGIFWMLVFAIPLLMKITNQAADWNLVFKAWIKIFTFFLIFIINIYVFIPVYLKNKKYILYTLWLIVITPTIIFFSLKCTDLCHGTDKISIPPMEIGPGMPPLELSDNMPLPEGFKIPEQDKEPNNRLIFFKQLLIAFLVIGTGTAYKLFFYWKEEEKQNKKLQQQIADENREIDEYIFVKSDLKMMKILISDVLYVESANEYIKINLDNGQVITTFMRLKNMESELPESSFMRVQRSFIINLDKIQSVEKNKIILQQMIPIPIGQKYKEKFQNYLGQNFIK